MTKDHTMTTTLRIVPAPKPLVCRLRDDGSDLSTAAADQIEALQIALVATAEAAAEHLRTAAERLQALTTLQAEVDRLREAFANNVGPDDPAGCPGEHGSSCCGWHNACRTALKTGA